MLYKDFIRRRLRPNELLTWPLTNPEDIVAITCLSTCLTQYEMDMSQVKEKGILVVYRFGEEEYEDDYYTFIANAVFDCIIWRKTNDEDLCRWCGGTNSNQVGEMIFDTRNKYSFVWCDKDELGWSKFNLILDQWHDGISMRGEDTGEGIYYKPKYVDGKVQLEVLRA